MVPRPHFFCCCDRRGVRSYFRVTQLLMEGTHQGAWLGIPASSKKMQIRMFTVHRVVQGKIVEDWVLVESLASFSNLELSRTRQTW
jgi:predicted ester cyclase